MNELVESHISSLGFKHFSFTPLEKTLTMDFYSSWIREDMHGEMEYMSRHEEFKRTPQKYVQFARSAIVLTQDYFPHPAPIDSPLVDARVAMYARGQDYHLFFQKELNNLCDELKIKFPNEEFIAFTDSKPVLERELAYKAGLGWFGKNTCLINSKKGSLFFIGEIYTSLDLKPILDIHPDRCGSCTRCIDACPTQALTERKLDARKCISYLTIEAKSNPAKNLRPLMKDWLFGCDICQSVCPWNEKSFGELIKEQQRQTLTVTDQLIEDLRWILTTSNKQIQKNFGQLAISRARGTGLKRNALIVAANQGLTSLAPEISSFADHEKLSEVALWALEELGIRD